MKIQMQMVISAQHMSIQHARKLEIPIRRAATSTLEPVYLDSLKANARAGLTIIEHYMLHFTDNQRN
ncbi:hypothetical protein LshimejAT787_0202090 [Lyophyllum shimeji]|uniref:Uncharacterized protein n=1 Tax=Lyophyllum shimeji TaxID=47721 RepID=A0A9P3UHY1_LYOSH|nr:hypothetical protein LshimejAT787_0202090 [Lyophyllum shimeji]